MQKLPNLVPLRSTPSSPLLTIIYSNGDIELYHPVPEFVYDNLLRRQDKMAFVQKYLEYNLHFDRVCLF